VYPSTDYVFDGAKRTPYVESDPVAPQSAYGRSKLAGEQAVAAANERHFIVRTSWLFGTHGKNFVDTMLAVARDRDELRVVDDQVGRPTYTAHLADALVELARGEAYGIHHVAGGGEPCSWFEFARAIFQEAGVDVRVAPCTTEEFPRPAPRPAYSVLDSERPDPVSLPDWRTGLSAYLAGRSVAR
jgi:dTDP-4-dehydrorhamnose reductase